MTNLRSPVPAILALVLASGLASLTLAQTNSAPAKALPEATVRYDGQMVLRAHIQTPAQLLAVTRIAPETLDCRVGVGPIQVAATPEQRAAIEGLGVRTEVVAPDLQAIFDEERAAIARRGYTARDDSWFTTYHDLAEYNAFIDQLAAANPTLVSTFTIGNSLEMRPIRGLRFSGPDRPGSPRSSRPALLFNGGQHAREWINPAVTIYQAHKMLERYPSDARVRNIVDNAEIIVIPILNPDGYVYTWTTNRNWRKNRRQNSATSFGVDLNRNWGYQWGGEGASTDPNNDTYRGTAAFSEPESQALRDFTIAEPRIRAHIDFHSAALLILSPWAYTATLPADAGLFDRINADMAAGIQSVHGTFYRPGPVYTNIYPAAGAVGDWMYGDRGILSWGIELRAGPSNIFILPPEQIIPNCEEIFEGVQRLSEFVIQPLWISLDSGLPTWASTTQATPIVVRIQNGAQALNASSVRLLARTFPQGAFTPTTLSASGTGVYPATLAAPPCGTRTEFYIEARTAGGTTVRYPDSGVLSIRSAEVVTPYADNFESDRGWTFGLAGDTATSGVWARGVPTQATRQPGGGASGTGAACLFTGLTAAAGDVDGGGTTATGGMFNGKPGEGMAPLAGTLDYWRWFATNQTTGTFSDSLQVFVTNDDGGTWTRIENQTTPAQAWSPRTFALGGLPALSTRMRMRVVATDTGNDHTIEAGFDDVRLTLQVCRRSADVDDGSGTGTPDGGVTIDDLLYYLGAFEQGILIADYTNDDGVTIDDLLLYLQTFEEGY